MKAWISFIGFLTCLIWVSISYGSEYEMPEPGNDLVGQSYVITVKKGDSLTTIRQKNEISYDELLEANPKINFYKLKVGQRIFIPKQFILPKFRRGIVINIPELRLYYFTPDGKYVYTFPVGLGRMDWRTPMIEATVTKKQEDPVWYVPKSIHDYVLKKTGEDLPDAVPPGPKNPLGKYALYLSKQGYLIHGTNAPTSVGTFISSGCMRLLREPIELLYEKVQIGTPVHVINYPNKAGWLNGKLYLESHKPVSGYSSNNSSRLSNADVQMAIYDAIHLRPAKIDWQAVSKNTQEEFGIPEPIGFAFSITN